MADMAESMTTVKVKSELGPLMLDLRGTRLEADEASMLEHPCVGGIILFSRNYSSVEQLVALVGQIRAVRPGLLIAVDQEGGRVQRFRSGFTRIPPMQTIGQLFQQSADAGIRLAEACGWVMAAELRAVDIDMSFAPVLDMDDNFSQVIGDRSFGRSAHVVVELARAFIRGMRDAGMPATAKHFPGHGAVRADSHHEVAIDSRSYNEIERTDMQPFTSLKTDYQSIMPAHVIYDQVDANPVGFSPYWLQTIVRGEIGFNGVIFSDDLSMRAAAAAGGYRQRAQSALSAGCDAVLVCNQPDEARDVLDFLAGEGRTQASRLSALKQSIPEGGTPEALRSAARWHDSRNLIADAARRDPGMKDT